MQESLKAHPHATAATSFELPAPFCVTFKARLAISYLMRSPPPVERGHPRQRIAEKMPLSNPVVQVQHGDHDQPMPKGRAERSATAW
jgi:hypothetical protein